MDEPNILIKTALNDAVQKVNEGMTPTAALRKVASDLDLNPNYIQRTGEALNVALHYKHFKTASDRSTEFEIADIPAAIEGTFLRSEKTAAEYVSEEFSVGDASATVFNYNRMLTNPVYKRAFMEIAGATETHDSYPATFNTVYEKSANYIKKLSKTAEEAEVTKVGAEIELNEKFSSLCDEFRRDAGYRTAFEEFESQVFAKHGSASLPYINLLHKTACPHEERGVHDDAYMMFDQCKEAQWFDSLMLAATTMVESEKKAAEALDNLSFENSFVKECRMLMGKVGAEKEESAAHENAETAEEEAKEEKTENEEEDPVLAAIKKKASVSELEATANYSDDPVADKAMEKEAIFGKLLTFGGLLQHGGESFAGMMHPPVSEAFNHHFRAPKGPPPIKPNLTLENMERKLLLQELMMTDPILSKVNPAKVARAFEQLLRLSPEISKEKEVVRAELRAMVSSQALSKFDAELMAKTDVGMLKRRLATQEFNRGETQNFRL